SRRRLDGNITLQCLYAVAEVLQPEPVPVHLRVKAPAIIFYGDVDHFLRARYLDHVFGGIGMFDDVLCQLLDDAVKGQLYMLIQARQRSVQPELYLQSPGCIDMLAVYL